MGEIQVNDYVRLDNGKIGKIITIEKDSIMLDIKGNRWIGICCIIKHSKSIKDLIENRDILKVKTKENEILMIGFDENTINIKYKEIIEEIENKEYELLEILPHEIFENNVYIIGE